MYLEHNSVKRRSHSLISDFLTQKFTLSGCYKNSDECHPLIFEKRKINSLFFRCDQKVRTVFFGKNGHRENVFSKQSC